MKILLIEDDTTAAAFIIRGLNEAGHGCDHVNRGDDGLFQATRNVYDLLIVDRMMPGLDGLAMVKALRAAGNAAPIIFLTAVGSIDDRVEGLEAGADDYLIKPFAFSELLARMNALLRRPPMQTEVTMLKVHDLEVSLISRRVSRGGSEIELKPKEFRLLEVLMRNAGRVVTRTMLLEQVWGLQFEPTTSVVETHISRLRNKIDKPFDVPLLHTVRTAGYSLHAPL